jgi:hypothetical protein
VRTIGAILLVLALASPVSAAKTQGSCSVTPNSVQANATLTITASASVGFDFYLTDPTAQTWTWPQGPAGTVSYQWATPLTGNWTVTVRNTHYPHPQSIGSCSFKVT